MATPETPAAARVDELRTAFIGGMDKCRETQQAYGEWPSLTGRLELAQDAYPDPEEGDVSSVEVPATRTQVQAHAEAIMEAWGIIANAGGGDWSTQSADWQRAAERFRDTHVGGASRVNAKHVNSGQESAPRTLRQTHTFATLEVSQGTYDEIKAKLEGAGYQHAFVDVEQPADGYAGSPAIDMHGIGLVRAE